MVFVKFELIDDSGFITTTLQALLACAYSDNELYIGGQLFYVKSTADQITQTIQNSINQMNQMQAQASRVPTIDLSKLHV